MQKTIAVSSEAREQKRGRCTPGASEKSRTVRLPVIAIDPETGMKRSGAGRRRAYVLGALHLLMILHVVHWLRAGSTLTPIEPSESMETIRRGEINMGFLFFTLAILATLIFGRWVCGWGCHLVAYQDLTLWILKKLKLRPKAFKTRFLFIVIPLVIAAGWMFLVPLVERIVRALAGHPGPELTWHLTRTGFWETFPGLVFGVLTLLVCGVAIIYFLGPKGFCTFACPYGAFFGLADKLAPARIRVTDDCNQCGHCTAVCSSNVNVAQEVNLYKMVVDPGCMKCLDCVNVCPNDALYVGFGRPAIGAKPAAPPKVRRYDLTLGEEIAALGVFLVCLVTINGLYGQFPFLMSLGTAAILTFVFLKAVQLFYARDVMLQKLRLKIGGRIQRGGVVFAAIVIIMAALLVHSGVWRYHDLMASYGYEYPLQYGGWQYDPAMARRLTPEQRASLAAGLGHLRSCQRIGFFPDHQNNQLAGWLYLFSDEREKAAEALRETLADHSDHVPTWLGLARVETALGRMDEARAAYKRAIDLESAEREALIRKAGPVAMPLSSELWREWGVFQASRGQLDQAAAALEDAVGYDPGSAAARLSLADFQTGSGQGDAARRTLIAALDVSPTSTAIAERLFRLRGLGQDAKQAASDFRAACAAHPDNVAALQNLGYALTASGEYGEAEKALLRAMEIDPSSAAIRFDLGAVQLIQQKFDAAIGQYERVLLDNPRNAEAALRLAGLYEMQGRADDLVRMLKLAAEHGNEAQRGIARDWMSELARSAASDAAAPAGKP